MSASTQLAENIRREKARNLRYKKAVAANMNLEYIQNTLYEMSEACDNVRYWLQDGDETLLDTLIGDEEEAYELRMAISMLSADCDQMLQDLADEWVPEFFDDFFGTINADDGMMGYDSYEGDYFGLVDHYEERFAQEECEKRLSRFTKKELFEGMHTCFRVAINYLSIQSRYDSLKAAIDILQGQNTGVLKTVKRIEELYEKVSCEFPDWDDEQEFDKLVNAMPDDAWIQ